MNENNLEDVKTECSAAIMSGISTIIVGLIFAGFCSWIFIKGADSFTKIVIIPFLICGIAVLIKGIVSLLQGLNIKKALNGMKTGNYSNADKLEKTHNSLNNVNSLTVNLYLIGFSIFWFGFLIVFDYLAIKDWSNGGSQMFMFSLIFWGVGIFMIVKK